MAVELGGLVPITNYYLVLPAQNFATRLPYLAIFDVTSIDDPLAGSSYSYRKEDITVDRVPTVRRLSVQYRDLGIVTTTWTLKGTNDNSQVVSNSITVTWGNIIPTKDIFTFMVNLSLTAFRPQATVTRAAMGGPLDIISVTMHGEVEEVTL